MRWEPSRGAPGRSSSPRVREVAAVTVGIESWGRRVRDAARLSPLARVVADFERSAHAEMGGQLICLVRPELGHGPLNAITRFRLPAIGEQVALEGAGARNWEPPPPSRIAPVAARDAGLTSLRDIAHAEAPHDGLARLALGHDVHSSTLEQIARPRVERLRRWLAGRRDSLPPTDLLGLGPGLTPSGDDLIGGVMIALATWDRAGIPTLACPRGPAPADPGLQKSWSELLIFAHMLTSPLSCAFLAAAADGEGAEALHLAINAVIAGDVDGLPSLIRNAAAIGHTSGWDALAGAWLALSSMQWHE